VLFLLEFGLVGIVLTVVLRSLIGLLRSLVRLNGFLVGSLRSLVGLNGFLIGLLDWLLIRLLDGFLVGLLFFFIDLNSLVLNKSIE